MGGGPSVPQKALWSLPCRFSVDGLALRASRCCPETGCRCPVLACKKHLLEGDCTGQRPGSKAGGRRKQKGPGWEGGDTEGPGMQGERSLPRSGTRGCGRRRHGLALSKHLPSPSSRSVRDSQLGAPLQDAGPRRERRAGTAFLCWLWEACSVPLGRPQERWVTLSRPSREGGSLECSGDRHHWAGPFLGNACSGGFFCLSQKHHAHQGASGTASPGRPPAPGNSATARAQSERDCWALRGPGGWRPRPA